MTEVKYAPKDPKYDDLADQIEANRENLVSLKKWWPRFAVVCALIVTAGAIYFNTTVTQLWKQSIEVASSKEKAAIEAIALAAEQEQIIAALNEKLRGQTVLVERTRQHEFHGRQDHAQEVADLRTKLWTLARSTRAFLHAYHDPEEMTDHLHNARAWWTYTNLKDRMTRKQIDAGSNLILHLYTTFNMIQSWTGDEPLADD